MIRLNSIESQPKKVVFVLVVVVDFVVVFVVIVVLLLLLLIAEISLLFFYLVVVVDPTSTRVVHRCVRNCSCNVLYIRDIGGISEGLVQGGFISVKKWLRQI